MSKNNEKKMWRKAKIFGFNKDAQVAFNAARIATMRAKKAREEEHAMANAGGDDFIAELLK